MSYQKTLSEYRRRAILRFLARVSGNIATAENLTDVCNGIEIRTTRDQMVADVEWLEGVGLVTLKRIEEMIEVRATTRGLEVGSGLAEVEGVRPVRKGE